MGWFNRKAARAHNVRDDRGVLTAKISPELLNMILNTANQDQLQYNAATNKHVCRADGFNVGHPELCKIMFWKGFTIDAVATATMD